MKQTIRINESQLKAIIVESVKKCLKEYRERKSYQNADDAPFIKRMNQFANQYGYAPYAYGRKQGKPEDYARQMIQRHNTFLRGIDTNMADEESLQYARGELQKQGIQNPTMQQIAQFAATHPLKVNGKNGVYASNVSNADIYGCGGIYGRGSKSGKDNFAGTAKIIRPYTLGDDRMKWFDEGDFKVRSADDYSTDGYESQQQAVCAQIQPGEVVDTWNNCSQENTEVQIGGNTRFGGWLSDDERKYNSPRSKSYDRNRDQVSAKLAQRRKVSQKDWDRYISSDRSRAERNYSDWLTSRNNYYRGE